MERNAPLPKRQSLLGSLSSCTCRHVCVTAGTHMLETTKWRVLCIPMTCWMTGGGWTSLAACVLALALLHRIYIYIEAENGSCEHTWVHVVAFVLFATSFGWFIQSGHMLFSCGIKTRMWLNCIFGIRYWSTRIWLKSSCGCVGTGFAIAGVVQLLLDPGKRRSTANRYSKR